jgi:hypothetical protein
MPCNSNYKNCSDSCVRDATYKELDNLRPKKARTVTDVEEKYLTPDEETEAEPARRKANKRVAVSRFNAELRRQADDEVQTLREFNIEEARIIREQN